MPTPKSDLGNIEKLLMEFFLLENKQYLLMLQ